MFNEVGDVTKPGRTSKYHFRGDYMVLRNLRVCTSGNNSCTEMADMLHKHEGAKIRRPHLPSSLNIYHGYDILSTIVGLSSVAIYHEVRSVSTNESNGNSYIPKATDLSNQMDISV